MLYEFHILYLLFATFIDPDYAASTRRQDNHLSKCLLKNITFGVFVDPPYTNINRTDGVISDFLLLGFKSCFNYKFCATKGTDRIQWKWVQSTDELEALIRNEEADLAFPVPPSLSSRRTHMSTKADVKYFSVSHSPGPALIVNYQACQRVSNLILIKNILSAWPILLLTLLLAGISGVCIWALEYRNEKCQFSKPFGKGSYDGFWWAVISMTTVGYGDQIPRSVVGRLFGVTWILTGVTLIAVFTALITSAITVVSVKESCNGMQGQHIGVVNNSEVEVIARHHGAIVKAYDDVNTMFSDLTSEKISGLLMDRPKAYYYLDTMNEDSLRVSRVLESALYYNVALVPGNTTGILTSNKCFMDLMDNPTGKMNRIMKRYIVPVKPVSSTEEAFRLFSGDSAVMTNTLLTITILLVTLIMCGFVWDRLFKRNSCFQTTGIPRQTLTNFTDFPMETLTPSSAGQLVHLQYALNRLTDQIIELRETVGVQSKDRVSVD